MTRRFATFVLGLALAAGATGCDRQPETPRPAADPTGPAKSIFRPEFQVEPTAALPLKPLEERVFFPEGTELTEQALETLRAVLSSDQLARPESAMRLEGHSDAGGADDANLRISQARAEAIRDWFIDQGIEAKRITIVAFGEQNPRAPNALPDGTPDEEGRAQNRRVEIRVDPGQAAVNEDRTPTLAETLATPQPDPSPSASE